MKNYATLRPDSPFYPLFPGGHVPIKNIVVPNVAECLGDGVQEVYMVDLDRLSPERFESVARLVHKQCDPCTPFEKAKAEMREHGLPLRAKSVASVSSDAPLFL
jgi:hypothetical protein